MDEVIDLLQQLMQQAGELADELSDEEMAEILRIFKEAIELIEQGNAQAVGAQSLPELQQSMPSSNIHSFGYDEDTGKLLVKFQGDFPENNGSVYSYSGVPKVIFDLFQKGAIPARTDGSNKWGKWWKGKVPSIGASMYALIKSQNYPYEKIS